VYGSNSVRFQSNYDFILFALAPALQELDKSRAAELLGQHPEAADAIKRFPKALASFASDDFSLNYAIVPRHDKPPDLFLWDNLGDPFDIFQTVPIIRKIPFTCSGPMVVLGKEGNTQVSSGQWCSYVNTFPRANLVQFITEGCINLGHPAQARAALRQELDILMQIPEEARVGYLQMAADLYLRLGDLNSAADVTEQGFTLAYATYERELSTGNLQKFPKGFWRGAEIYREMITLVVNASLDRTRKTLADIPDSSLRELEEVMLARALLGVPLRRSITTDRGGNLAVLQGVTYEDTIW
jgi:hypothetical protein